MNDSLGGIVAFYRLAFFFFFDQIQQFTPDGLDYLNSLERSITELAKSLDYVKMKDKLKCYFIQFSLKKTLPDLPEASFWKAFVFPTEEIIPP